MKDGASGHLFGDEGQAKETKDDQGPDEISRLIERSLHSG